MRKILHRLNQLHFTQKNKLSLAGALFVILLGSGNAQVFKIDPKFQELLKQPKTGVELKEIINNLDLKTVDVIKPQEGNIQHFPAIIYANNVSDLKKEGILVQSETSKFATALVTIDDIRKLSNNKNIISVQAPQEDGLHNDIAAAQAGVTLLHSGVLNETKFTGKGILVGIYDTGIDWSHPDFRELNDQTKSRIYSIWDQTITANSNESTPNNFSYGVEYTKEHINDEIDGTPANYVREKDTNSHGTHVAATAAGNGAALPGQPHKGMAPESELVIVKGGDSTFPQSNTIDAIKYFQQISDKLNKPIVVNMSIGGQGGAHDGSQPHEIIVDEFTQSKEGRVVVISAGNDYGEKLHKRNDIKPNGSTKYTVEVGTGTGSSTSTTIFNLNTYFEKDQNYTILVTVPDGKTYQLDGAGFKRESILDNTFNLSIGNTNDAVTGKKYGYIYLSKLTLTSTTDTKGIYTIELINNSDKDTFVDGWLTTRNSNSVLVDGDNTYIVGSPGTSTNALTVGAYRGRISWYNTKIPGGYWNTNTNAEDIASFSAEGPRADGVLKPEITASGQQIVSAHTSSVTLSATATGTVDGKYYTNKQGTSMSSPVVAGSVALLLQANPKLNYKEVKDLITKNANKDIVSTVTNRWGHGKLDIYKAVSEVTSCAVSDRNIISYEKTPYQSGQDGGFTIANNSKIAIKFSPTLTGKIGNIQFYIGSGGTTDPITAEIKEIENGLPGKTIASRTLEFNKDLKRFAWNTIDFTSFDIDSDLDKEFFVVLYSNGGTLSIRAELFGAENSDNRSFISKDGGEYVQYTSSNYSYSPDFRVRTEVYEHEPAVKKLIDVNANTTKTIKKGNNFFTSACSLITSVYSPDTTTVDVNGGATFIKDDVNKLSKTINLDVKNTIEKGKVKLYFTQDEFNKYNENNTTKLPTSATDTENGKNLIVLFKPTTGNAANLVPTKVKWNSVYKYWEVEVDQLLSGDYSVTTNKTLNTTDNLSSSLTVYPNPVSSELNIGLPSNLTKATYKLFNLTGQTVLSGNISNNSTKVSVNHLTNGVYILELTTEKGVVTKKVIKN